MNSIHLHILEKTKYNGYETIFCERNSNQMGARPSYIFVQLICSNVRKLIFDANFTSRVGVTIFLRLRFKTDSKTIFISCLI